jgi:FtsP/CotA-like multicopper oxidase with cupredoxin domain
MLTKAIRSIRLSRLLTLAVLVVMALVLPASFAQVSGQGIGLLCTPGPTFNLRTATGYASFPDGNSLLMWSFVPDTGPASLFQTPGPVLCVTEGDTVTVNLVNDLAEPVSIVFPGQTGVTATGAPGLFTAEAGAGGGTASYTFTAGAPGTYLYESGTNPHRQIQMGLFGALIVRPAMGANFAYNDATTQFDPAEEFLILTHDLDPELHFAVEDGRPYDVTTMRDRYWTINGRSFPDTMADNNAPWLPGQPYGAIVQVQASADTPTDLPALIRYLNAGMENHPFHPHGNHLRVIARDGRLLRGPGGEDISFQDFTRTIGSGQTYDLLFWWSNVEAWTSTGNPVPVIIPGQQNLVYKDGLTFYSGSPYLGETGDFPAGNTVLNECGEFYYPWHSHALNEFQNFDEGFGGLATALRVDPPGGCP